MKTTKDMSNCFESAMTEFKRGYAGRKFDCAVMLTYNSETGEASNCWNFDGHPSDWNRTQLCDFVQKLTAVSAEAMKSDVNFPEGRAVIQKIEPVSVKPFTKKMAWKRLFGIALGFNPKKPLWVSVFSPSYFGVGMWGDTDIATNGTKFWKFIVNCLLFTVMISKDI